MAVWKGGGRGRLGRGRLGRASRSNEADTHSGRIKGCRVFISSNTKPLSNKPSHYSLSVAGGWVGLASILSYSMRTPMAIDCAAGSHTWLDRVPSGSDVMSGLIAPSGVGCNIGTEVFPPSAVRIGCSSSLRCGNWLGIELGVGLASSSPRQTAKQNAAVMTYFCRPTRKLVSHWFPRQKPNRTFHRTFGLTQASVKCLCAFLHGSLIWEG